MSLITTCLHWGNIITQQSQRKYHRRRSALAVHEDHFKTNLSPGKCFSVQKGRKLRNTTAADS